MKTKLLTMGFAAAVTLGLQAQAQEAARAGSQQIHDAPYYNSLQQHGPKWAKEDQSIDQKLAELEAKHGKKPNIIYILADDIGWGELGCYGGGKVRGTPTPNLDRMAADGMKFLSNYTEPACTPTRIALMTGRYPVRTGVSGVLWPGEKQGLVQDEVTIAELLSDAGYDTAMWGKWHVGETEVQSPESHGFDQSFYMLYNGAAFAWPNDSANHFDSEVIDSIPYFLDVPKNYEEKFGISLEHGVMRGVRGEGRKPEMGLSIKELDDFEAQSQEEILQYV
ncbi:MAG: sulfatase-like hydrolase/transferase, partial [Coraliomargarita sp.]